MDIQYEWRTSVTRKGLPVLSATQPDGPIVFRSLYGYNETTAAMILSNGNTRGLQGHPVYSDTLIIDADTHGEAAAVDNRLDSMGISYEKWDTGNRGAHFHIPITPMKGPNVVWSQIKWLKDNELWDLADTSIYREGGQIRVPNAIHSKTGKPKTLLSSVQGNIVRVPIVTPPPRTVPAVEAGTPEAIQEYLKNLLYRRRPGQRHTHLFILWERGRAAGIPEDQREEDLVWWNERYADPPHSENEIRRKVTNFK